MPGAVKGLRERLADGETVLAAEGYVFETERRGYLSAGPFVPVAVLENPQLVVQMTEEFVHSGSDVVLAFQYYGHREKLRIVGRENDLEALNRKALEIAREVANRTGTLMAGNICNTTCYDPSATEHDEAKRIFKEQVEWCVEAGADFVLAETYNDFGEAMLALEAIKQYGKGMPSVICLAPQTDHLTRDGLTYDVACRKLEEAGADVVGLNCNFGPETILPEMRKIRKACKGPIACLPVPYRTTPEQPQMQSLMLPNGKRAFYENLDHFNCARDEMTDFGNACKEIGIQYVGLCCGNSGRYFRKLAESLGRTPPASKYSPNMKLHFVYGEHASLRACNTAGLRKIYTPAQAS